MIWTSPKLPRALAGLALVCCACSDRAIGWGEDPLPDVESAPVIQSCLPTMHSATFEGERCPAFILFVPESPKPPGVCTGCFCAEPCATDDDCANGLETLEGLAQSTCDPRGWCVLDCSELSCPEGMECIDPTEWGRPLCHWVITEDHQDACQDWGGP